MQSHSDALVADDQIFDAPVRLERGPELRLADARDDEVEIPDREPEQLVANAAADEVRVEFKRVDVVGDRAGHDAILRQVTVCYLV